MTREPETAEEWQEVVDLAYVWLMVDSARKYGLVSGGPEVNVERCQDVLQRGRASGIRPHPKAVERFFSTSAGCD